MEKRSGKLEAIKDDVDIRFSVCRGISHRIKAGRRKTGTSASRRGGQAAQYRRPKRAEN
jgi:hypothetical protein